MQLTKTQKTLHILFRVLVFLSFGVALVELFLFMTVAVAADTSVYSYVTVLNMAMGLCAVYYIQLVLGVAAVVFSVICFKTSSVAATVVRSISLVFAAGFQLVAFPAYDTIRRVALAYFSGNYHSILREYNNYSQTDFEEAVIVAVLLLIVSIIIYFVLSITSIVALAQKPTPQINPAYRRYYQNLYGRNPYGYNPQRNAQNNYGAGYGQNYSQSNEQSYGGGNGQNNAQNSYDTGYNQNGAQDIFDENGVKQGRDGRKILRYDTMTGEPVYADEAQKDTNQAGYTDDMYTEQYEDGLTKETKNHED